MIMLNYPVFEKLKLDGMFYALFHFDWEHFKGK